MYQHKIQGGDQIRGSQPFQLQAKDTINTFDSGLDRPQSLSKKSHNQAAGLTTVALGGIPILD